MDDLLQVVAYEPRLLIVPVMAVVIGAGWYLDKARKKAFRQAALDLGLKPSEETYDGLPSELTAIEMFLQGRSRTVENAFWSERRDFLLFDYRYTVGGYKSDHTHRQTVGAFHCPGRSMPAFAAAPEDIGDWFSGFFGGGQDIDFEHDPKFSAEYRLRGKDEAAIREFFSVGGTQYLAARPGWNVHAHGEWLVAYREDKRVDAKKLKTFVWDLQGLYGALLGL